MKRIGLYIDFDNYYYGLLDTIDGLYYLDREENKNLFKNESYDAIREAITENLDQVIKNIEKYFENTNIVEIKAYSDFSRLPYNKEIDMHEILQRLGIKPFKPMVSKYKDMADRALILDIVRDIFLDKKQPVDSIVILTGDIDYLPLFELLKEKTIEFSILTFKNRYNSIYNSVRFTKDCIIFIDELLSIDTRKMEFDKKYRIFKEFIINYQEARKSEPRWLNNKMLKNILTDINRKCYFKIEEKSINNFIKNLINERILVEDEIYLSSWNNENSNNNFKNNTTNSRITYH